jgi:hypothetical protein
MDSRVTPANDNTFVIRRFSRRIQATLVTIMDSQGYVRLRLTVGYAAARE